MDSNKFLEVMKKLENEIIIITSGEKQIAYGVPVIRVCKRADVEYPMDEAMDEDILVQIGKTEDGTEAGFWARPGKVYSVVEGDTYVIVSLTGGDQYVFHIMSKGQVALLVSENHDYIGTMDKIHAEYVRRQEVNKLAEIFTSIGRQNEQDK
jgi:hypothetical protein